MAAPSHKTLKEQFVSNLSGSSVGEINLVLAVAPVAYILFAALQSRLRFFEHYGPLQALVDPFLNCGALLLSTTLYSSQPVLLNLLLLSPALLLCSTTRPLPTARDRPNKTRDGTADLLPKKAFLTVYRGGMMVITCIAILAVDFHVFPRRFAKVENWGTSVMDLGVGSFVFSGGLVAVRTDARGQASPSPAEAASLTKRMKTAMRASLPLLVLGFVRLAMVKGVDYAEHVTEYGVHWNFFFTLGLLPPFVALLQSFAAPKRDPELLYAALALAVAGAYQVVLLTTGLQEYVLVGDRHKYGLLGMNKEGASSFFGYLAIFLSGMGTGSYLLPRNPHMLKKLVLWATFWLLAFLATLKLGGSAMGVSRRLANISYVLWVAAHNTTQILAVFLVERTFFGGMREKEAYKLAAPRVLEAFNRNGLVLFLLANLLTGAVNISVNTLTMTTAGAMGILVAYTSILVAMALFLDWRDLSIKL